MENGGLQAVDQSTPENCDKKLRIDEDYLKNFLKDYMVGHKSWLERQPVMCAAFALAVGACSEINDQVIEIAYDGTVEGWVSVPGALIAGTGAWTLYFFAPTVDHPVPWAFLANSDETEIIDLEWVNYFDGKAWFAGSGDALCDGIADVEECPKNSFRVAIGCCHDILCEVADPLVAVAMVAPDPPVAGETASFSVTASGGVEGYTYAWDFGDESGGSLIQNPDHVYAAPGTYTVSVTVGDACGNFTIESFEVTVVDCAPPDYPEITTGVYNIEVDPDTYSSLYRVFTPPTTGTYSFKLEYVSGPAPYTQLDLWTVCPDIMIDQTTPIDPGGGSACIAVLLTGGVTYALRYTNVNITPANEFYILTIAEGPCP